jgi:hypothetical protein
VRGPNLHRARREAPAAEHYWELLPRLAARLLCPLGVSRLQTRVSRLSRLAARAARGRRRAPRRVGGLQRARGPAEVQLRRRERQERREGRRVAAEGERGKRRNLRTMAARAGHAAAARRAGGRGRARPFVGL